MYELDLSGKNPDNLIKGERTIIANCYNRYRCFIPNFAPFFSDTLKLKQIISGKVVDLIEGIHYEFGHYYQEGSVATKRRIYGSIILKEPMTGVLEYNEYQTLGGGTNTSKAAIAQHLGEVNLDDPRNIDWSEVLKYSTVVTALDKPSNYGEAIATDEIISELEGLNKILTNTVDGQQNQQYNTLRDRIAALNARMVSEGYYTHLNDPIAHGVSPTTLMAYPREATVEDTLTAYGKSLEELSEYCLANGISQADIDKVMDSNTVMSGQVTVSSPEPIQAPGSGVVITESNDGTSIEAKGSLTLTADKGQKRAGIAASIHCGTHILSTYSGGKNYRTPEPVMIDGFTLVSKLTLKKYLGGYTGSSAALDLKTQNTPTVALSGNGTAGSPLSAAATFPIATTAVKGLMAVTNTMNNMPPGKGCSTRILYEMDKTVSQYALGIYTLNGKPLTSDVVLTLADFQLGNVNNTTLAEKPLSEPWKEAVANKAVIGHTHPMDQEYPLATPNRAGTIMLTDTKGRNVVDKAASVKLAKQYKQEIQTESGKTIRILVGRTLQLGQVPEDAVKVIKNGMFIAFTF